MIFGNNQFMLKHTVHIKHPSIYLFQLDLLHLLMLNGYEIRLNTTNYPICNMQDFRYWLHISVFDYVAKVVSPPCCRSTALPTSPCLTMLLRWYPHRVVDPLLYPLNEDNYLMWSNIDVMRWFIFYAICTVE